MKNLENSVRLEAYKLLKNLMSSTRLTEGIKRAIRVRLELVLDNELKEYQHWKDYFKEKQSRTLQKDVERKFNKRIQAFRITIHALTPFFERVDDVPTFVRRKDKPKK